MSHLNNHEEEGEDKNAGHTHIYIKLKDVGEQWEKQGDGVTQHAFR